MPREGDRGDGVRVKEFASSGHRWGKKSCAPRWEGRGGAGKEEGVSLKILGS